MEMHGNAMFLILGMPFDDLISYSHENQPI